MRLLVVLSFLLVLGGCAHGGHKGMHKMWEKMDANGDNAVTKEEFTKAHDDMFTELDADKDGKVTKEEKMAFFKSKCKDGCGGKDKHECKDGCDMKGHGEKSCDGCKDKGKCKDGKCPMKGKCDGSCHMKDGKAMDAKKDAEAAKPAAPAKPKK